MFKFLVMLYIITLYAQIIRQLPLPHKHLHKKPLGLNKPLCSYDVNKVVGVAANNSLVTKLVTHFFNNWCFFTNCLF